ncbi:hypothetical protein FHS96_004454 [Sphingomonas zeicaulis]|uniref:S1/P1 nuclease n=1 Tax=Sphingomonas zeicaulis TaxID=1632740 RepID=UPI003D23ACB1
MKALRIALALLTSALVAAPASAWWDFGHEAVAGIAMHEVRPETRAAIRQLLRHAPDLATPTCKLRTIEDASVWPDCIKMLGERFSYAYSWHYQNIDICKPFDLKAPCRDGNCVSAQIDRNRKLLADKSLPARERLMALAFLVHFVGDLHQPMHAGDHGDLGGNRVKADYGIAQGRINLHSIWDGYLAERAITTPPAGVAGLISDIAPADRAAVAAGSTEDWSRENWQIAHDVAYGGLYGGDPCLPAPDAKPVLSNAAIEAAIPVVRKQVERGGLRLARLLDEALG